MRPAGGGPEPHPGPPGPARGRSTGTITDPALPKDTLVVSGLTAASRVVGFIRTLVMTSVLGITFLGNTYATANGIPNVVFELVAGGAVAALLVPALSASLASGDKRTAEQTANSVLNAALLILTPLVVAGALLKDPLMAVLTSGVQDPHIRAAEQEIGSALLLMFLPQIWLYAVGIVLTAVLHVHGKFVAPAIAPLLSSLTVTACYLLYRVAEGPDAHQLQSVSTTGLLILGLGTTAGVAVLALSMVPAVRRLDFSWRPVLSLPAEARSKLRSLAAPAVLTVGGQQLLLAVVLVVANRVEGGVVAYQLAFMVLLLFWAVLPLPVATTAFPGLAGAASRRDQSDFARRCSKAFRSVLLLVFAGAAVLAATARPGAGAMLSLGVEGGGGSRMMVAWTLLAFAPGLVGYGIFTFLSRAAFALGDGRSPGAAAAIGFGSAIALNLLSALIAPAVWLVPALAGGFSAGMLAAGVYLLGRFRRAQVPGALEGSRGGATRALLSGLAGAAAGLGAARVVPGGTPFMEAAGVLAAAAAAAAVYFAVLKMLGDPDIGKLFAVLSGKR